MAQSTERGTFPLGETTDGRVVEWDVSKSDHLPIYGLPGVGKTVTQNLILSYALQSPPVWDVTVIDLTGVSLAGAEGHPSVSAFAITLEDAVVALQDVHAEMTRRIDAMNTAGVEHVQDLDGERLPVLVVIDELIPLITLEGVTGEWGEHRDFLHSEAAHIVEDIAYKGGAAGIHMSVSTQRADEDAVSEALRNSVPCKIVAGRASQDRLAALPYTDATTPIPDVPGGALFLGPDGDVPYVGYFITPENLVDTTQQ